MSFALLSNLLDKHLFWSRKGIQKLSKFCAYLAFIVLIYISFLAQLLTSLTPQSKCSFMGENFLKMAGPSSIGESEFSKAWTIFMWAWFFGLPLLVSLLQNLKGRTIRTMILGSLGFGTMGTSLFS